MIWTLSKVFGARPPARAIDMKITAIATRSAGPSLYILPVRAPFDPPPLIAGPPTYGSCVAGGGPMADWRSFIMNDGRPLSIGIMTDWRLSITLDET